MADTGGYTLGDLNADSWPAFEEFFNKYNGVQNSCWCVYYHKGMARPVLLNGDETETKHDLKRRLVEEGKSRSALVFRQGKVVASCQYGLFEELPRIENAARYTSVRLNDNIEKRWRVTCFFVDTPERHRGLAKFALDGALDRIARNGGGLVEAYPVIKRNAVEVWFGSVSMFEERGFRIVSEFGKSNVLVRKMIDPV